jgi:hypothetical protein
MASTLKLTVAHAISYLTRPLILSYPATTVIKLQLALEANLTALFAPTWLPTEPHHGSSRRALTLSPGCLPPPAIYTACLSSGVQWFDWIALLGGREFDLFVDPASVSVRFAPRGSHCGQVLTIWSEGLPVAPVHHFPEDASLPAGLDPRIKSFAVAQSQTLAQQLLAEDKEEDEELFAILADEISTPTWMTPICDRFPISATSPIPAISAHSRSSSRSSNSSSNFSFASSDSCGSSTTVSTPSSSPTYKMEGLQPKRSRRERARQARVFVDCSKTQVTPYEGGKTTVLTGGVMLGAAPVSKLARPPQLAPTWRTVRA